MNIHQCRQFNGTNRLNIIILTTLTSLSWHWRIIMTLTSYSCLWTWTSVNVQQWWFYLLVTNASEWFVSYNMLLEKSSRPRTGGRKLCLKPPALFRRGASTVYAMVNGDWEHVPKWHSKVLSWFQFYYYYFDSNSVDCERRLQRKQTFNKYTCLAWKSIWKANLNGVQGGYSDSHDGRIRTIELKHRLRDYDFSLFYYVNHI